MLTILSLSGSFMPPFTICNDGPFPPPIVIMVLTTVPLPEPDEDASPPAIATRQCGSAGDELPESDEDASPASAVSELELCVTVRVGDRLISSGLVLAWGARILDAS